MKLYTHNSKVEGTRGLFWVCTGLRGGTASAVWLEVDELTSSGLAAALEALKNALPNETQFDHRVVGCAASVQAVTAFLSQRHETLRNSAAREGAFTILFYPENARVQVSKGEAAHQVKRGRTRVLIVDDSKTIRTLLTKVLSSDSEIEVVGAAEKPSEALQMMKALKPDVITLDIHMPEMDGVTFLKSYLPAHPIPTVMISSISIEEGPAVLSALEIGAVDYVQKPNASELAVVGPMIIEKVKIAATVKIAAQSKVTGSKVNSRSYGAIDRECLVAIGSSTGGTEALRSVLTRLPADIPPIVIVQHIPAVFSKAFADRMNQLCPFEVKEAAHGDEVKPGRVIIAAGGTQMSVKRKADGKIVIVVEDGAPVNRHKPSVDVLFDSVAEQIGAHSVGVILTGMGADGSKGMLRMKKKGSRTIAQDEESCVVFGMPREAIKLGAADEVVSLREIPDRLVHLLCQKKTA
jgi:two-component system chemotaxis response regulator CheB